MQPKIKELFKLLMDVNHLSKKDALTVINGLTGEGQVALTNDLRRKKIENEGQGNLQLRAPQKSVEPVSMAPVKAKKVPYTVLLPPSMVDRLKAVSEEDGAPVSHHIRLAIKAYLSRVR